MNKEEVLKLSKLARIEISDTEAEKLTHEFESILNYVGEIKEAASTANIEPSPNDFPLHNVMRADTDAHEGGIYTEDVLKNAPDRKENFLKVKKIIQND